MLLIEPVHGFIRILLVCRHTTVSSSIGQQPIGDCVDIYLRDLHIVHIYVCNKKEAQPNLGPCHRPSDRPSGGHRLNHGLGSGNLPPALLHLHLHLRLRPRRVVVLTTVQTLVPFSLGCIEQNRYRPAGPF